MEDGSVPVLNILATGQRLLIHGVRGFEPVIHELIQEAEHELHLAVYRFDASALPAVDLLAMAARRGGRVTVVVSSLSTQPPAIQHSLNRVGEREPGIRIVDFSSIDPGLLHLKAVVADRRKAVIGSANLTWGGMV